MRNWHAVLATLLLTAACGPRDRCQVPAQPSMLTVAAMTRDQKADAMGIPPSRVPPDAVAGPDFDAYVAHHNAAARIGYCVDNEAYKARKMTDDMKTVAHAVMGTCQESDENETLAAVMKYRTCAAGN